jgi:hypothetical protein
VQRTGDLSPSKVQIAGSTFLELLAPFGSLVLSDKFLQVSAFDPPFAFDPDTYHFSVAQPTPDRRLRRVQTPRYILNGKQWFHQ